MTSNHDQLRIAFERLAQAAKECLDTYERVCRRAEAQDEPAAGHHARLAAEPAKCPNCPPGYDCESGNYSYDDFEAIRDEQASRAGTETCGWVDYPPLQETYPGSGIYE